ncbi:MAG: preprotein translocase [Coriobacteriia bacterium]|nr:preprotein translocase [Coriobacteriia bacterium]
MNPAIFVGIGFLAGTVGMKAVTSQAAKNIAVAGMVQGMKVKECCEGLVDEAKAEFDDIMAEAEYQKNADAEEYVEIQTQPESKPAKKPAAKRTTKKAAASAE